MCTSRNATGDVHLNLCTHCPYHGNPLSYLMSRTENSSNVVFTSEWQTIACKPQIACSALYTEDTTGVMNSNLIIAAQGILYTEDTVGVLDDNHNYSCMCYINQETSCML